MCVSMRLFLGMWYGGFGGLERCVFVCDYFGECGMILHN